MLVILGIVIIIACIILALIILVQNPKGGGMSGNLGGVSTQLIGVKNSTDIMEKATWIVAAIVAVLCILTVAVIPTGSTAKSSQNSEIISDLPTTGGSAAPASPSSNPNAVPYNNAQPAQENPHTGGVEPTKNNSKPDQ